MQNIKIRTLEVDLDFMIPFIFPKNFASSSKQERRKTEPKQGKAFEKFQFFRSSSKFKQAREKENKAKTREDF